MELHVQPVAPEARGFPGVAWPAAHPEDQNEDENNENLRNNEKNCGKMREDLGNVIILPRVRGWLHPCCLVFISGTTSSTQMRQLGNRIYVNAQRNAQMITGRMICIDGENAQFFKSILTIENQRFPFCRELSGAYCAA